LCAVQKREIICYRIYKCSQSHFNQEKTHILLG
jgi:hypothetical protein